MRRFPTTLGIIAVCVGVFVATLGHCAAASGDVGAVLLGSAYEMGACRASLEAFGGLAVARVWIDGEWWRVASAGLEHGSWLHLILNTWSLWVVGQWAERCWGSGRLAVLFAVSSVAGCLASMAWAEAPLIVGASAGILGIAAALWVVRTLGSPERQASVELVSSKALGLMLLAMVGLGFVVPVVAQAGHLGGLFAGAWIGWLWSGRVRAKSTHAICWAALLAAVSALGIGAREPAWRPGYYEYVGFRLLEMGDDPGALEALDRALSERPDDASLQNAVAYALAEAGRHLARAEGLVESALEEEPENADYLDTLGWIRCRQGRVEEAMPLLRQASELTEGGVAEIEGHLESCASSST